MSKVYEEIAQTVLEELKLETALSQLDQASQQAAANNWSYSHFLGYLFDAELKERHRKKVEMAYKMARFPYLKALNDYDFSAKAAANNWNYCHRELTAS